MGQRPREVRFQKKALKARINCGARFNRTTWFAEFNAVRVLEAWRE
jgi:hypothetical protein